MGALEFTGVELKVYIGLNDRGFGTELFAWGS